MKIAATGYTGKVGKLLVSDYGVYPLIADITNEDEVNASLDETKPDVVIHLAGISDVDFCQEHKNLDTVMKVNYNGAVHVIRACNDRSIGVVYLSTEQVFSGRSFLGIGGGPYSERDIPDRHVANMYALMKLAIEGLRHSFPVMKVVRSSHLFNYRRLYGEVTKYDSFPTFIKRSYIYLPHFVANLSLFAKRYGNMPGVLHLAGSETISQYDLMKEFVRRFKLDVHISRRRREIENIYLAPRPYKVGLNVSLSAALGFPQYSYMDGMVQMERDFARE